MGWTEAVTVFAVIATNLGTVIALYLNSDRKIDENRKEALANHKEVLNLIEAIRRDIQAIHAEMKDFHGRLCEISAAKK